jgi:hypothetical protein
MAPNEQLKLKTVGLASKATITEDEERWTDLCKDETENTPAAIVTPSPAPIQFPGPFPLAQSSGWPPQPSFGSHPPQQNQNQAYFHPPGIPVFDVCGRPFPSEQAVLEAQLVHLGEVTLGLATAVSILETHLIPDMPVTKTREIQLPRYQYDCLPRIDLRSGYLGTERTSSSNSLRDIGYLIGLKRAVKILEEAAAANEDLEKVTYKIVIQAPLPPPVNMMAPPPFPPALQSSEFRVLAKEIVKDTVREYTEEVAKSGSDEVQKEMIKLCRAALTRPSE